MYIIIFHYQIYFPNNLKIHISINLLHFIILFTVEENSCIPLNKKPRWDASNETMKQW